jgi:hypothetical protein
VKCSCCNPLVFVLSKACSVCLLTLRVHLATDPLPPSMVFRVLNLMVFEAVSMLDAGERGHDPELRLQRLHSCPISSRCPFQPGHCCHILLLHQGSSYTWLSARDKVRRLTVKPRSGFWTRSTDESNAVLASEALLIGQVQAERCGGMWLFGMDAKVTWPRDCGHKVAGSQVPGPNPS